MRPQPAPPQADFPRIAGAQWSHPPAPPGAAGPERPEARIVARLRARLGADQFLRFFGEGRGLRLEGPLLTVEAPSGFGAALLDRRFKDLVAGAARDETGLGHVEVRFTAVVAAGAGVAALVKPARPQAALTHPRRIPDAKSRFASTPFVLGASNRLAHDAVARLAAGRGRGGTGFLTITGPCGVGKTHLLHAAAAIRRSADPAATVKVTSGDAFVGGFVSAVNAPAHSIRRVDAMRREHRLADLLCVDDLATASNKSATLTELLHTMDAVVSRGGLVVVALPVHPRNVEGLGPAIVSRLLGGLVVSLMAPDRDLRVRLAKDIARRHGMLLDEPAAAYVADHAGASVREIEGLVLKVEAVRRLLREGGAPAPHGRVGVVGLQRALEAAAGHAPRNEVGPPARFGQILAAACAEIGVSPEQVLGSDRTGPVVLARSLAGYVARRVTRMSFPEIARDLGRSNHSTVITACQRVQRAIDRDDRASLGAARGDVNLAALTESLLAMFRPARAGA